MFFTRRDFVKFMGIGVGTGISAETAVPPTPDASGGPIRLDNNEGAYGPSEKVADAIRLAAAEANRYPGAGASKLTERIANYHNVSYGQVVPGSGSTEILRMASCAFLGAGKQLVQPSPTFPALEFYARSGGAEVISDPLNRSYYHDLDAMLAHTGPSTGLVYICNPNNPTGSITPRTELEKFIASLPSSCHIVIDEAYHHYAGLSNDYASFLDRPLKDPRIVVTRTFSHAYGLAGLRIGYGITFAEKAAAKMRAFATADAVSTLATHAAIAALDDAASLKDFVKRNADDHQEFQNNATARSLKPLHSHANFVAMDTYNPASVIVEHFRTNNILISPVSLAWDTWIRVSLGKPEEMKAFWRTWDTLPIDKSTIRH